MKPSSEQAYTLTAEARLAIDLQGMGLEAAVQRILRYIEAAEREAFEAGYRYGRKHEKLGMAFTYESWESDRRLEEP